ncbi:MAG: diguanylate cyclase [Dehalococcoidia bacterium]|nr:diguanylate cyclase [Dehalococcoidia bacterium]
MANFFATHMLLVFFVYGLAWFVMGIAILLTPRIPLRFPLAANLPWLAGFALVHSMVEWMDMIRLLPPEVLSFSQNPIIQPTKLGLLAISGVLLLRFGSGLVSDLGNRPWLLRWLPVVLSALWLASPIYSPFLIGALAADASASLGVVPDRVFCAACHPLPAITAGPSHALADMLASMEVLARYLLYLPAMALSAVGLYMQGQRFKASGLKGLATAARWAAATFGVNTFFSGLIVAPAPFYPAVWLNYHSFVSLFAVPPQVFHALAAAASAFFLVNVLGMYRVEQERQLSEAREDLLRAERQLSEDLSQRLAGLTDVLADLHSLSERVLSDVSFGSFIRRLAQAAIGLMHADGSTIFLQTEAGEINLACAEGSCIMATVNTTSLQDIAHSSAANHKSLLLQDVVLDCGGKGELAGRGSVMAVPLLIRQEVLGVITVQAMAPRQFGDPDLALLQIVSGQLAVALQNARLYALVSEQAIRDGLTGLYNHRYFQERLGEEIKRAGQDQNALSLIFCDLDNFKQFNDANGHTLGDCALQAFAALFSKYKRETDLTARYGGEEFAAILPACDTAGAVMVAERIRREVAGHAFQGPGQAPARLTVSIGVATYPRDAASQSELIDKADWAMYNAKRHGRNRIWAFSVDKDYAKQSKSDEATSENLYLSTIHALAAAEDARDHFTHQHSEVVALYSSSIARQLGLAKEEVEEIETAALLHDVGNIGVRDDLLNKRGSLTEEELLRIREHSLLGEDILGRAATLLHAATYVRHHHERFDGEGYPDHIGGEDIPLGARIIAVADAFHAMISDRPYRPALPFDQALEEMRTNAGHQFDPRIVEAFLAVIKQGDKSGNLTDSKEFVIGV